jgi:hypothetical protein
MGHSLNAARTASPSALPTSMPSTVPESGYFRETHFSGIVNALVLSGHNFINHLFVTVFSVGT